MVAFDGFLRVYREGRDEANGKRTRTAKRILPDVKKGEAVDRDPVDGPEQHFTQPPPRFTEASLVKRLEELGIGRPSTYASIIEVLQKQYVRLDKRRFTPEDRGRLVTAFLTSFFHRYVEYSFTADLEDKLDDISGGRVDWKLVLREFWTAFIGAVDETKDLRVREVLDALNDLLGPHLFGEGGSESRACVQCDDGQLSLKLGKFGAFIGCSNYPECRYTRPLEVAGDDAAAGAANGPRVLGTDPDSGLEVTLRKGPYGIYVQLGEGEGKTKPKRASLTKTMTPESVDLQLALALLALPRDVGPAPRDRRHDHRRHRPLRTLHPPRGCLRVPEGRRRRPGDWPQPRRGRAGRGPEEGPAQNAGRPP